MAAPADDRHLGNGLLGILDLGADGTDQLKAEKVVNDRTNIGDRVVHSGHPVGDGEIVGKAVFHAVGNAHEAENHEDAHLDDGHDVGHEHREFNALHADVNDDPAHRDGDDRLKHDAHFGEQSEAQPSGERRENGGHPERHVDPVHPADENAGKFAESPAYPG